jgi:two-component system cell cycle sensor histidine kinase/response regulator CckA
MEAVGQLAAGVAHDFNNVLTVIQGCSEFLLATFPKEDERREDVDMIRDAALRASTLTRQLLAFSRKQVLQLSTVDLNECVSDLERIVSKMIGEDISLVTDLAPELDYISADVSQLEQVIVNMSVNARDAMPNGGELQISTRNVSIDDAHAAKHPGATTGPHVRLSITDNGCGMDPDTVSRIFEPFFTTKGVGKGTGLGLATAYGIIRQSAGHIDVTSIPGAGTSFDIYLPVCEAARQDTSAYAGEPAPSATVAAASGADAAGANVVPRSGPADASPLATAHPRHDETVLLVEDDARVRALAAKILLQDGYDVVEAENGADALRVVRGCDGRIDLVVTDAMMPVMNGGELASVLALEFPAIKVLFMSLFTGDSIVRRGADERRAFLPKPFSTNDLTGKVREVLGTPGTRP